VTIVKFIVCRTNVRWFNDGGLQTFSSIRSATCCSSKTVNYEYHCLIAKIMSQSSPYLGLCSCLPNAFSSHFPRNLGTQGSRLKITSFIVISKLSTQIIYHPLPHKLISVSLWCCSDGSPLLADAPPSTEIVIEEGSPPQYRCDYCFGCLFCERGHKWYSIHGKGTLRLLSWYFNISTVKSSLTFVSRSKSVLELVIFYQCNIFTYNPSNIFARERLV